MLNTKKLLTKILVYIKGLPTYEVKTVQVTGVSISANNVTETSVSAAKSGYTPVGVLGFNLGGSGVSYLFCYHLYLSGSTLYYAFRNNSNTARSGLTLTFYVLYSKN